MEATLVGDEQPHSVVTAWHAITRFKIVSLFAAQTRIVGVIYKEVVSICYLGHESIFESVFARERESEATTD